MDTKLKHVLKEEFVVYYNENGDRRYLTTVYSSSINTVTDVDDAMKLKNIDAAKAAMILVQNFSNKDIHICHIATVVEEIDLNSYEEEESDCGI